MEGEKDSEFILRSNCIELKDENATANCKKACYQLDSSTCEESENISNVAVTTRGSVNITDNEKPPKLELKRLSGWMSQKKPVPVDEEAKKLGNKENCSNTLTSRTTEVIVSTIQSGE